MPLLFRSAAPNSFPHRLAFRSVDPRTAQREWLKQAVADADDEPNVTILTPQEAKNVFTDDRLDKEEASAIVVYREGILGYTKKLGYLIAWPTRMEWYFTRRTI